MWFGIMERLEGAFHYADVRRFVGILIDILVILMNGEPLQRKLLVLQLASTIFSTIQCCTDHSINPFVVGLKSTC